jgi:hypothetical protein
MTRPDLISGTLNSAVFSDCGKYRYRLYRRVGRSSRKCLFIMLNPSTADAFRNDPTICRCITFAQKWGCGVLVVVNLFGFRATSPKEMLDAVDPVGPENHRFVVEAIQEVAGEGDRAYMPIAGPVVCAWGTKGGFMEQDQTVLGWIRKERVVPMCLRQTKAGHPAHPLYLPKSLDPIPMGPVR